MPDRRQALALLSSTLLLPFAAHRPHAQESAREAEPRRGGTLTLVEVGEPTTLVPLTDSNTRTRNISTKVTEGLLRFDANFAPQPLLATAWSVSEDGLRYRFALRPDVRWHDGKPFTAADVRFSLLALKTIGPRGRITFANLVEVETPDPLTAILVLSKPTPYLLKALTAAESPIVPAHVYPSNAHPAESYGNSPNGSAPIGTGPYIVVEWVRGSHVALRRNPDYWQPGRPYLDRIVVRFVADTMAVSTALEAGEADVSYSVALPELERLRRHPRLAVTTASDDYLNNAQVLEFNLDRPVLARREVRRALASAIDRRIITGTIFNGHAEAAGSTIPAALKAYNDEAPFAIPFDPARANRLLDEAGLPRGPDGARFALRLTFLPGPTFRKTAEYLRAAFTRVGVKVEIADGDLATFIRRVYTERDFDFNLNGISRLFDPTVGVQRLYWSDGIKRPLPYLNAAHYDNPAVDDLFRQAATEVDEARRREIFRQIQVIVGADLPAVALVTIPTVAVQNARVQRLFNSIDLAAGDCSETWLVA
ncbi:peptide/nickel transport system substrate-binding protein [Methylobacterium sp. 174MFSha1.1]|uniref:ABC transporter substrate-binding protein n=1 Tax=Methylobacterium sp. 174MFSha1.1 TaxID=1502749 RepID=UPI0008E6958F|nr:ABC transporter substrate-binding protein [Methylobacterium sp. 174MFSha1.1]SFV15848.1 peptide/nickel transport system substrate-binding protein [Methylobacterium sp. 174MFSha1.1]